MILKIFSLVFLPVAGIAAEAHLMIAPQVRDSNETSYSEELANFYGTNIYLFESEMLAKRVVENHKDIKKPLEVTASQIEHTSILKIVVSSGSEEQGQAYLNTLLQEYKNYKQELRQQAFAKKKAQLTSAIQSADNSKLKEEIQNELHRVKRAELTGTTTWWIRVK